MASTVRLSDLAEMRLGEREALLTQLAGEAKKSPNGHATAALGRVRAFEARYEVSSEQMLQELRAGGRRETAEIAEWLFWLRLSPPREAHR